MLNNRYRIKRLLPPLRGLNKNWGVSMTPQFYTADLLNVRPRSVLDNRAILGQRPGLKKAYSEQLGSGKPVVAMCQVSISNETSLTKYVRRLVAASGDKIYYENTSDAMVELTGAVIDTDQPVVLIEAYQKVFVINGTTLGVIDFVNTKLTTLTGSISAFANYGGTVPGTVKATTTAAHGLVTGDYVTISGTTNYNGSFEITKIDADEFYFIDTWVSDDATGTWKQKLVPCPTRDDILNQDTTAEMVVDFVNPGATEVYGKVISSHGFDTGDTVTSTGTCTDFTPSAVSSNVGTVPLWYSYTIYPDIDGADNADFGTMPTQATFGCLYRGRITLGGDKDYPHQINWARQTNPWNYAYFANDMQSAVPGSAAKTGEIGEPGTAVIAYSDNYLVIAGASTIYVLSGDPTNGTLRQISFTTGIWSRESWCKDEEGRIFFLGLDGIYMMPADLSQAINLTKNKLPKFMEDWAVDPALHRVTLSHDPRGHGLLICRTLISSGANDNYWFDLRVADEHSPGGFFPEEYPTTLGIFSSVFYQAENPANSLLLVGCFDGYIMTFDAATKNDVLADDSTVPILSDLLFGPFPLNTNPTLTGKITSVTLVIAGGGPGGSQSDTDSITYEVYIAKTAEGILEAVQAATPKCSGVITGPGKSRPNLRKIKGIYGAVRLKNTTASETWAINEVLVGVKRAGRLK